MGSGSAIDPRVRVLAGTHIPSRHGPADAQPLGTGREVPEVSMVRMEGREREFYDDLRRRILPGLVADEDEFTLVVMAKLLAKVERDEASAADLNVLIRLFDRLGMTPDGRLKAGLHLWQNKDKSAEVARRGWARFTAA